MKFISLKIFLINSIGIRDCMSIYFYLGLALSCCSAAPEGTEAPTSIDAISKLCAELDGRPMQPRVARPTAAFPPRGRWQPVTMFEMCRPV